MLVGTTHFKSNIAAKNGTETISGFASVGGTALTATGAVSGATVTATGAVTGATVVTDSYVKIGTNKYILGGGAANATDVVASVAAVLATPFKGSLYLSDTEAWLFTSDSAVSTI